MQIVFEFAPEAKCQYSRGNDVSARDHSARGCPEIQFRRSSFYSQVIVKEGSYFHYYQIVCTRISYLA